MPKIRRKCSKCGNTFYCNGSCNQATLDADNCLCGNCLGVTIGDLNVCNLAFRKVKRRIKVILV
jgi:hypothetical protein